MENLEYPLLKKTSRIKKMLSFCWIVETASGDGTKVHPIDAFLLSLCTGEYDLETIKYIYAGTFDKKEAVASDEVEKILRKLNQYISWSASVPKVSQRYNPKYFLYDIKQSALLSEGRFDTPGEMTLILTHACNFRCIYCFNSSSQASLNQLKTTEWLDIVEQAKNLEVVKFTLSGGEPMMHPGFFEILEKILKEDMLAYVCTNGSLINSKVISKFSALGLSCIQISLDCASERLQDRLTGVQGTLPKVINAINSLVEAGIEVYIKAVLTPLNFAEAENLINLCHQLGAKKLVLDRFDLSNAGRGGIELFMTHEQEIEVAKVVERKQRELAKEMSITAVTMPRCWFHKDDLVVCGAFTSSLTILPEGNISVCEKLIDVAEMTVGNVKNQSLDSIWRGKRIKKIINPSRDEIAEPCKSCELLPQCRTGCYAQTLLVTDNPYEADPRCWKANYLENPYKSNIHTGGLCEKSL
jgi:pyrroloquinoline quinone biosynthesis protein E